MDRYIDPPPDFNPQPLLEKAFEEIMHYTAIFILKDGRIGSGVFANTCGHYGIVTAYHVAEAVMRQPEFAMSIAQRPHSLWLRSEHFEHVEIGHLSNNPNPEKGPDLSFIIIREKNLLAILHSLKSFCFLDTQKLDYFNCPLERLLWAVAGSPFEAKKTLNADPRQGVPLVSVPSFIGEARFLSREERDPFDYVAVRVQTGGNYPSNYEGVSGGGLWVIPLEGDEGGKVDTISHARPILAGVAFFQSAPANDERIITGHGYDSIHSGLRRTLNEKVQQRR